MPDQFGNLDRYERAYLRSTARKESRRIQSLRTRKNPWAIILDSFLRRRREQGGVIDIDQKRERLTPSEEVPPQQKVLQERSKNSLVKWVNRQKQSMSKFIDRYTSWVKRDSHREDTTPLTENEFSNSLAAYPKILKKYVMKKVSPLKKSTVKNSHWIRNLLFVAGTLTLLGFIGFGIWFTTLDIPDVNSFEERKISNSTKIYDRTGEILLYDIHENVQRSVANFEDINQYAKDAIVAIEDHTFYEHHGVVLSSTLRAIAQTILSKVGLSSGGTAGGSTITQQVVKNTLLNSKKLLSRKVKEWVLAYKIEQRLSKDKILEIYLNEAPYGGTIYGIKEASRIFFGTTPDQLTLAQAAYLAAIPNLPTYYSPYGPNKDKLDERQRTVLSEMKRYGYITDSEYRAALEEEVTFLSQEDNSVKALHFVQYVRSYLEETYGVDLVENGGLQVVTTLDYALQQQGEEILKNHIAEVEDQYDASNAALVAIEAQTGQIISMVGSRDYFDQEIDGNFNVAIAKRQPGSSFKPIAYANAFEQGYLPETVVFDTKTQFNSKCSATDMTSSDGCYAPTNYDNKFNGPMSLRNALAQSRNIPAVKMLYLGGLSKTLSLAQEMGITSLNKPESYYGLGLVLGGGEVSLLELTGAYTVFANDGNFNQPTAILSVEDADGNILESYQPHEERVLSKNVARMISSILSDNEARTPLFGSQSFLYFGGRDVAGKTGTTNDNRDAWLIGYTSEVAVGVWTGNNDNSPMKKGSSISGKPWRAFMDAVIDEYGTQTFGGYDLPENFDSLPPMVRGVWQGGSGETVYIDSRTGRIADEFTPEEYRTSLVRFDPHTILYWINKDNPDVPNESKTDPQYVNWEASVASYASANFQSEYDTSDQTFSNLENQGSVDVGSGPFTLEIHGIDDGETFQSDDIQRVSVGFNGISLDDIDQVDFFIDDHLVESDNSQPFTVRIDLATLDYLRETNVLSVVGTSHDGVQVSSSLSFIVRGLDNLTDTIPA